MRYKSAISGLKDTLALPSPVQQITPDWLPNEFNLFVKRDDLIHPTISGNKWRKLKYSLNDAIAKNVTHIVSFGGPHSNHIHALGFCCFHLGIKLTAIIRGKHHKYLSPTLTDLKQWNADLEFVTNLEYRQRYDQSYIKQLVNHHEGCMIIPEGGTNKLALKGVAELLDEQPDNFDYCFVPVGSGGTLAGLIQANKIPLVEGVSVLKGAKYIEKEIKSLIPTNNQNWRVHHDFHCGGYGKSTAELIEFCRDFEQQTNIKLEPIYSGKLFLALKQLCHQNHFPANTKILAIHTGGLQGARS